MTETTETIETATYIMTAMDRCDACSAQALVLVRGVTGELQFCGHHYNKHSDKLAEFAYEVIDERDKINPKPFASY
mgnify:FL=1